MHTLVALNMTKADQVGKRTKGKTQLAVLQMRSHRSKAHAFGKEWTNAPRSVWRFHPLNFGALWSGSLVWARDCTPVRRWTTGATSSGHGLVVVSERSKNNHQWVQWCRSAWKCRQAKATPNNAQNRPRREWRVSLCKRACLYDAWFISSKRQHWAATSMVGEDCARVSNLVRVTNQQALKTMYLTWWRWLQLGSTRFRTRIIGRVGVKQNRSHRGATVLLSLVCRWKLPHCHKNNGRFVWAQGTIVVVVVVVAGSIARTQIIQFRTPGRTVDLRVGFRATRNQQRHVTLRTTASIHDSADSDAGEREGAREWERNGRTHTGRERIFPAKQRIRWRGAAHAVSLMDACRMSTKS